MAGRLASRPASRGHRRHLDLPIANVTYPNPGALADAAGRDEWDLALLGAEPQPRGSDRFTPPNAEIEATYLVPAGSPIRNMEEVDRPGIRTRWPSAQPMGLWLDRNIRHARCIAFQGSMRASNSFSTKSSMCLRGCGRN